MKRVILLVLIYVLTSFIITTDDYNPDDSSVSYDEHWEFVKNRLFDGRSAVVYRVDGPILLKLIGANSNDSLLVNQAMNEIKSIIPHKEFDFLGSYKRELRSHSTRDYFYFDKIIKGAITFSFNIPEKKMVLGETPGYDIFPLDYDMGSIKRKKIYRTNDFFYGGNEIQFLIREDVLPSSYRYELIRHNILRSLYFVQENREKAKHLQLQGYVFGGGILDLDKFLLQKLYGDDFLGQFKEYMHDSYDWVYTVNFLYKDTTKVIALVLMLFLWTIIFIISFSIFRERSFKYSYLSYFFPLLITYVFYFHSYTIFFYTTNLDIPMDFVTKLLPFLGIGIGVALIVSFVIWLLEKLFINPKFSFIYQMVLKVTFTFAGTNLLLLAMPYVGLNFYTLDFYNVYLPYFVLTMVLAFGRGLLLYLNHYSASLVNEKEFEVNRLQALNSESELKLLQAHINPHFLYNALNSIAGLAHTNAAKTEEMALSLSDLFRYTINQKEKRLSTVADEIVMVQNYLKIEQIRFGARLEFSIDVDTTLNAVKIPMFILQPLVENAVKHGTSKIEGIGKIVLKIYRVKNELVISVSDNGPYFPDGLVSGHGLQTIYDLLYLTYGENAALQWQNSPEKKISITIQTKLDHE